MSIFPIRHGITIEEIREHSPSLVGLNLMSSSDQTIEQMATIIVERLRGGPLTKPSRPLSNHWHLRWAVHEPSACSMSLR